MGLFGIPRQTINDALFRCVDGIGRLLHHGAEADTMGSPSWLFQVTGSSTWLVTSMASWRVQMRPVTTRLVPVFSVATMEVFGLITHESVWLPPQAKGVGSRGEDIARDQHGNDRIMSSTAASSQAVHSCCANPHRNHCRKWPKPVTIHGQSEAFGSFSHDIND